MSNRILPQIIFILICSSTMLLSQSIYDDFEGNGNIASWANDDCGLNLNRQNPYKQGINTSNKVLEYNDTGGQYANIRFDVEQEFKLYLDHNFSFKIYVPSNTLTGNQPNQIALKLQDGSLAMPWETQTTILKPIELNKWQTVTFDFKNDPYFNLNPSSRNPVERLDFNRVLLQVNGENNNDRVIAYIDDVYYADSTGVVPLFDKLVWSDEFDIDGRVDSEKWHHQTQLPTSGGWFNNEIQHYTNRLVNSIVENGILKIIARKETFSDQGFTKNYTSARLNSKFAFTYGRIEIMAKLPRGVGTWPAMWMLGKNINEKGGYWQTQGFGDTTWPDCGEIDILEHWGTNQNYVTSATHAPASHGATINVGGQVLPSASDSFHLYTLEWSEEAMLFGVDGKIHLVFNPKQKNSATWPFDKEQYILLNVAIQDVIDPFIEEAALEIDYIRVYQESSTSIQKVQNNSHALIFPNLVDNVINIQLETDYQKSIPIKIHDMSGKIILESTLIPIENQLNLTKLERLRTGYYVLTYRIDGKVFSHKFFKK